MKEPLEDTNDKKVIFSTWSADSSMMHNISVGYIQGHNDRKHKAEETHIHTHSRVS